ncbi:MAG: hypothetical protein NVV72_15770 [Asticcacaulis sp.]|nr:hypothetical protein [Asticcacaulis sp.]
MSLPKPKKEYSQTEESQTRAQIDRMDQSNRKKGQDVEIAGDERLIVTDSVTGDRGVIGVAAGVVTWTAL